MQHMPDECMPLCMRILACILCIRRSAQHYRIPVPRNYIESVNSFSAGKGGKGNETKTQIMWQVMKPES